MNAEKFVKDEAKKKLSEKWPIAILSVLVILFMPIITVLVLMIAYSMLGETENVAEALSGSPIIAVLFTALHLAAVLVFILLSPIYAGFVRVFSSIANGGKNEPSDLFYFFDNKARYKSTVKFMTGIIMKSVGIFLLCDIVGIGFAAMSGDNYNMLGFGVLFIIIGSLIAFCCIHRFAFSIMLFSYYDYDSANAVSFGAKVAKGNTGKLIKLTVSFVPWLLLTFFVVPFVYVYPYMTCSYFVSVKYILRQYEEQFGNVGGNFAGPNVKNDSEMSNIPQANTMKQPISHIPPITEKGSRESHFPQGNNSVFSQSFEKTQMQELKQENTEKQADIMKEEKTEYDLENFKENKGQITLEKGGTVE